MPDLALAVGLRLVLFRLVAVPWPFVAVALLGASTGGVAAVVVNVLVFVDLLALSMALLCCG